MTELEAKVLRWCRKKTTGFEGVRIKNFTDSWADGRAFCALIHVLRPEYFDYHSLDHRELFENLSNALDIAEQTFRTERGILVEDLTTGKKEVIFELLRKIYNYTGGKRYLDQIGSDTEPEEDEDKFLKYECSVCFGEYGVDHGIVCSPSGLEKNRVLDADVHQICVECLQGQALALCSDGVLAPFGVGLKCVDPKCDNVFQWAYVSELVTPDVQERLGNRMFEEVVMAIDDSVERCKSCPFAAEIAVSVEEDPIFDCIKCAAKFCRRCKADWAGHENLTCAEVAGGDDWVKARKEFENDLTNAITRKCHRCGLIFAKESGCNKMTCRCGATQCYCCRQTDIDYGHFGNGRCNLYSKREELDEAAVQKVKTNAAKDPRKQVHVNKF